MFLQENQAINAENHLMEPSDKEHTQLEIPISLINLLRFASPAIIMMLFIASYTIVDGIFVANYLGTEALAAVNIVFPFSSIIFSLAIMLSTGGSALVGIKLGSKAELQAKQYFTLLLVSAAGAGICLSAGALIFREQILSFLGAEGATLAYAQTFFTITASFAPVVILQILFENFFITIGKARVALGLTIVAGLVNAALDYLFLAVWGWGIEGAALATAAGSFFPVAYALYYFTNQQQLLAFVKPIWEWAIIKQACFNGSSEMISQLSGGIIALLFNIILLKLFGIAGVAAVSIVLYSEFLVLAIYSGFSMGIAPLLSYNYGGKERLKIKKLVRLALGIVLLLSSGIYVLLNFFTGNIVALFVPINSEVYILAKQGLTIFAVGYILAGVNIFAAAMFTAFGNGRISAILAILRTFVFIVLGLYVWPKIISGIGVWLAVPCAELLTIIFTIYYLQTNRKRYSY